MTNPTAPRDVPVRLDFDTLGATVEGALTRLGKAADGLLDGVDFGRRLRELVRIRASQLNGCAYCVDMHTKDARAIGETDARLTALPVWRETGFFDDRDRAALTLTETVVRKAQTHVPTEVYDAVAAVYDEKEITALLSLIITIDAWNAIGVTTRVWQPGTYQR